MLDPVLFTFWCALWMGLALLLRRGVSEAFAWAAVYDWNVKSALDRAKRRLGRRGWPARHGLPDVLVDAVRADAVTVAELEEIAPRPEKEAAGRAAVVLTPEQQAEVDAMAARVDTVRETFAFTEPSRDKTRTALQAETIMIPVVTLEAVDAVLRTRHEFANGDDAAAEHDLEFATRLGVFLGDNDLLVAELGVARMYRGWMPSHSGEYPIVEEVAAA